MTPRFTCKTRAQQKEVDRLMQQGWHSPRLYFRSVFLLPPEGRPASFNAGSRHSRNFPLGGRVTPLGTFIKNETLGALPAGWMPAAATATP